MASHLFRRRVVPESRHASGRNVAVEQINTQPFMHFIHESNVCSCPLPSSLSFKPSTILYCAEALNCNCLQIYTQIYRNIEKYSPYAIVILYALEPPETLLVKELLLALPPCHTSFVVAIQCTGLGFNESLADIEWIWLKKTFGGKAGQGDGTFDYIVSSFSFERCPLFCFLKC